MHNNWGAVWKKIAWAKTRQGKQKSDKWGRREPKTDKREWRVQEKEKISQNEWKRDKMSWGGGEGTRCPVSGTCWGRQISRWSVPKCPPAVCNRIFQATAGSLWRNFVHGSSQIRVNAAQRFLHFTRRFGSLSLPPHLPAVSAPIRHKGFLPAKLSGHFWHLQQTNCCLLLWQVLWSPNELASFAQMKKSLAKSISQLNYALSSAQSGRGEDAKKQILVECLRAEFGSSTFPPPIVLFP